MKVLVTGGPVPAKLDAVKVVTNRFKGGLMAGLADSLAARGAEVTYLCSRDSKKPGCAVLEHDGFHDYRTRVHELCGAFDAVVLGAAVANLLPVRWQTDPGGALKPVDTAAKFPSHHFSPGDVFSMEWQIAPRVISETKRHLAPGAHLFGFKLLSGAPRDELVSAAYEIVLAAGATAVFANDAKDLFAIHAVTKERGVHSMHRDALAGFILEACADLYYRTEVAGSWPEGAFESARRALEAALDPARMVRTPEGLVFGTAAVRALGGGFFTTERGKRELDGGVHVLEVDHERRLVRTTGGKATLNAPLLDRVFRALPTAVRVAHYHQQEAGLPSLPWAPPGTVRDAARDFSGSFNIADHGCLLAFDGEGRRL